MCVYIYIIEREREREREREDSGKYNERNFSQIMHAYVIK